MDTQAAHFPIDGGAPKSKIVVLDDKRAAFEKVIKVYEPGFELAAPPSRTRRALSRETASGRVTEL
ncbi:hypothetical protein [Rhizobium gallicum]|uniref:hypothetical protein n=1 Tax=Rhizobium gallicum TaxID=56730 RepID=UPI00093AFDD7|nr:hypothetical protein [Rhizobium gallicum]